MATDERQFWRWVGRFEAANEAACEARRLASVASGAMEAARHAAISSAPDSGGVAIARQCPWLTLTGFTGSWTTVDGARVTAVCDELPQLCRILGHDRMTIRAGQWLLTATPTSDPDDVYDSRKPADGGA